MADLIPYGTDPNGRFRQAEDGDNIVDRVGNPLGGGKPTPATYGVEGTPVMTGDRVLTDASPIIQRLDPGDADRSLTLPALTNNTPFFIIQHIGFANTITIRNSGGGAIGRLSAGEGKQLFNDGSTTWSGIQVDFATTGLPLGRLFVFGGDITSGQYRRPNGDYNDINGVNGSDVAHIVGSAGEITHFYWHVQNSGIPTATVYVNDVNVGSVSYDTSVDGFQGVKAFDTPILFAAGDHVALQHSTDPGDAMYALTGSSPDGYSLSIGGYNDLANEYLYWNPRYLLSVTSTARNYLNEYPVIGARTGMRLAISSSVNFTGFQFKLWKNGVDTETVTFDNVSSRTIDSATTYYGIEQFTASFADGDLVAIQQLSSMGTCHADLVLLGDVGTAYQFGGDAANPNYYYHLGEYPDGNTNFSTSQGTIVHVAEGGLAKIGWRFLNAPTADHQLYKNGALSETVNLQATSGTLTTGTTYASGDSMSVRTPASGTQPRQGSIAVLVAT